MKFLPARAWSCCREVLLQVCTCLSQDIAEIVSYETQLSCNIQQASTLEEDIFSPFNHQLMLKFLSFCFFTFLISKAFGKQSFLHCSVDFFGYNSVLYVLLSTLTMQPPCIPGKQAIIQKYMPEKICQWWRLLRSRGRLTD